MDYDAYDALLHHIFRQTQGDAWFKPSSEISSAGVCLRVQPGQFRVFPYENPSLEPFEAAIRALNPVVAIKVRSAAVNAALNAVSEDTLAIYIDSDTRIQIVETMPHVPRAEKEQCAAFVRDERCLVIWTHTLDDIIPIAREFEDKLIKLVWRSRAFSTMSSGGFTTASGSTSSTGSAVDILPKMKGKEKDIAEELSEKLPTVATAVTLTDRDRPPPKQRKWGFSYTASRKNKESKEVLDPEKGGVVKDPRPIRLLAPFYGGLGFALSIFFIGSGFNIMLQEFVLDGVFLRFALVVVSPFLICVSLFFCLQVVTNIAYLIGPVTQYHENSRYYSAVKPGPNPDVDTNLPHITIQLPVYKEGLDAVIRPSVLSLKKAMQTYARQGGTSAIMVNDDGMQLISEADRKERKAFYADHNIGWVARPGHSSEPDGYKRAGRFKKASNMNYGLQLSLLLEKHLLQLEADGEDDGDDEEGGCLEDRALALAVEEVYEKSGRRWKPWACNARSLRVGELILICDSDTIVPEDCFRDAARELAECPDVAIIQHESDVMQVAHHYFENGIAHFTRRINKCISMGCANGEVAPFVGHNAFLRWSALQDAAFIDPLDGVKKVWSESNVSEDFDMALRLQLKGYIIRWANYSEGGFKEGVSLTVDDELNRWQKYSYGCNELIFNPMKDWWRMGPITKQLRIFMWSNAPVHYKITMCSYMFSYYGLAASALLSLINYIALGYALEVDGFYEHSFEIWLACTVVFPGTGNLGFTLMEYRLGHRDLIPALIENMMWVPFFFFFFGGLSIHLSIALLAHMFSYNITWGATIKEVERSNFFQEVPRIWKRFWVTFLICFIALAAVAVLSTPLVPVQYQVDGYSWAVILPLAIVAVCHILFPIVLNPWLMIFSY